MADNRDLSIQSLYILLKTPPPSRHEIGRDALRRGLIHGLLIRATLCLDAAKGPKKGKIVKSGEDLEKRTNSLLQCTQSIDNRQQEDLVGNTSERDCYNALLSATLGLSRVLAVINAGLPSTGDDSMEDREQRAYEMLTTSVKSKLDEAKNSAPRSVKVTCYLLPNYVVPLYATFIMCAKICDLYGWGKRKHKSKRCAEAMRDVAETFLGFLSAMVDCISVLPVSEDDTHGLSAPTEYSGHLDEKIVQKTLQRCARAQYRTRMRVEPILFEMKAYLASFACTDDNDS
jgi:hypothetical protein